MGRAPKYVVEANRVLNTIASQPDGRWARTQRELSAELDLRQPVLSSLLKLLEEQGRIMRGEPIAARGRTYSLDVIDPTPLPLRRAATGAPSPEMKRYVEAGTGSGKSVVHLQQLAAYAKALHRQGEQRETQLKAEVAHCHRVIQALENRVKELELVLARRIQEVERADQQLRRDLVQYLEGTRSKKNGKSTHLLDDESRRLLDLLRS